MRYLLPTGVLAALLVAPALSVETAVTLRTRPTDFHVRRGPTGPELVVCHSLPGYVSVRPAVETGAAWDVQRHLFDPVSPLYAGHVSARSVDLDGDGDLEIVVARRRALGGSVPADRTVAVFWETGRDLEGAPILERELFVGPPGPVELEVADLDGDGTFDLVFATAAHQIYAMRGSAGVAGGRPGFESPVALGPVVAFPSELAVHDLDGDGLPEVAFVSRHQLSAGLFLLWNESRPGGLAMSVEQVTSEAPLGVLVADLDGDGVSEIVVSHGHGATQVFGFGPPPGTGARLLPPVLVPSLEGAARLQALDHDGDGRLDFLFTDVEGGVVQLAYGDGWPQLRRGPQLDVTRATLLHVLDADGDAAREVWLGADNSQQIEVWRL